jgi:hypothetical protein
VCKKYTGVDGSNIDPLLLGLSSFTFIALSTSPILFGIDWNRWISSIVIHSLNLIIILSVVKAEDLLDAIAPARWQMAYNSLATRLSFYSDNNRSTIILVVLSLVMVWIGVNFQVGRCCERYIDYHGVFNYLDSFFITRSEIYNFLGI